MRTTDMLLIAAAAYFFLGKSETDTGTSSLGTANTQDQVGYAPYAASNATALREPTGFIAPAGADVHAQLVPEILTASGLNPTIPTPAVTPTSQAQAVSMLQVEKAAGADVKAVNQEIMLASLPGATPKSTAQIAQEVKAGTLNLSTGGLSAQWTGTGFYNPFTGVTHIPTVYA